MFAGIIGMILIFLILMFCIWSGSKLAVGIMVGSFMTFVFGIALISSSDTSGMSPSHSRVYGTIFLGGLCILGMVTALILALLQYF